MDAPFPFGFPPATAFYLTLYVLTLIIHAVFMNYVVAGTGYVAVARLLAARRSGGEPGPLADTLVDWLPFLLGAAITAGVAPLLFVQVLYRQEFYTANLLLFHRWMAILPVLIVGFYLLYLCKSSAAAHWPGPVRALIALGALACVCFTGYSWTENHVLSRQNAETWSAFYASGATVYRNPEIVARLAVWLTGSIPTMVLLVAWQTWYRKRMESPAIAERCTRHMAVLAIAGLALAAAGASAFYIGATESARRVITGPLAGIYLGAAVAGLLAQLAAWLWLSTRRSLDTKGLAAATAGLALTMLGTTVVREAVRLDSIDIAALYDRHADASGVGGFAVFIVFFAVNAVAIAWCITIIRRSRRPPPTQGRAVEKVSIG